MCPTVPYLGYTSGMATSSSNVAAILNNFFTTSLQDSDQLALSEMVTDYFTVNCNDEDGKLILKLIRFTMYILNF